MGVLSNVTQEAFAIILSLFHTIIRCLLLFLHCYIDFILRIVIRLRSIRYTSSTLRYNSFYLHIPLFDKFLLTGGFTADDVIMYGALSAKLDGGVENLDAIDKVSTF